MLDERTATIEAAGNRLAYAHLQGRDPVVVFLPGFASDMQGAKALHLCQRCAEAGQSMLRLDYSGHGASAGTVRAGTIGSWTEDAAAVIEAILPGRKLILVGSSMGGWIALLLLRRLRHEVVALVGIAAAPDFTEDLIKPGLPPAAHAALARDGMIEVPSDYGAPTCITRTLLEEGASHLVLRAPIDFSGPVRLIHGQADTDVPYQTSLRLAERITSPDIHLLLIKDGGHRLSRDTDLALIGDSVMALAARCKAMS